MFYLIMDALKCWPTWIALKVNTNNTPIEHFPSASAKRGKTCPPVQSAVKTCNWCRQGQEKYTIGAKPGKHTTGSKCEKSASLLLLVIKKKKTAGVIAICFKHLVCLFFMVFPRFPRVNISNLWLLRWNCKSTVEPLQQRTGMVLHDNHHKVSSSIKVTITHVILSHMK